jgi:hypothetical protein
VGYQFDMIKNAAPTASPEHRRVRVSSASEIAFMRRQTPNGDGVWENTAFRFDIPPADDDGCDWLLVYDHPQKGLTTRLPKERRILCMTEPSSIRFYDPDFINQFGVLLSTSPYRDFSGPNFHTQPSSPWFYKARIGSNDSSGRPLDSVGLQELDGSPKAGKTRSISAICSKKQINLNQVRRIRFLSALKRALGNDLEIFGRGYKPISDKSEGLAPFRYTVVLENSLEDHCWTEKFADAVLADCYPIYAGCGNIRDYFDPDGFAVVDTTHPKAAVRAVTEILAADPAASPEVGRAMQDNKHRLLYRHQFFPQVSGIVNDIDKDAGWTPVEAAPIEPPRKPPFRHIERLGRGLRPTLQRLMLELTERG